MVAVKETDVEVEDIGEAVAGEGRGAKTDGCLRDARDGGENATATQGPVVFKGTGVMRVPAERGDDRSPGDNQR